MKNIFRRYFWVILDFILIYVALTLSLILRFGEDSGPYFYLCRKLFIYLPLFYYLFALLFRLYKRVWRYLSINDLFLIIEVATAGIFSFMFKFDGRFFSPSNSSRPNLVFYFSLGGGKQIGLEIIF